MGRLATNLAATVANADNLPSKDKIPQISFWDAILPKAYSDPAGLKEKKPLDPNVGMRVQREFYDIKKHKNGKKMMIAHKNVGESDSKAGGEEAKKDGNGGNGKKDGEKAKEGEKRDGGGGGEQKQAGDGGEWTAEQDAKILSMKAEGKTWAEIGAEVGHSKNSVKNRHKEISGGEGGNAGAGAGNVDMKDEGGKKAGKDKAGGGDKGGDQNKKDKKGDKTDKGDKQANKAEAKKGGGGDKAKKAPSKFGSNGEARFTMGEWMTLQEDDLFSFGELQCLSELLIRDDRMRWLRISSEFFNKTGRRVHPEDIREKFEEMGAMGS